MTHNLLRPTDGQDAVILQHSRAIGAPKRATPPARVRHPVHPMCLAMTEVYRYEPDPDPRTTEFGIKFLGRVLEGDLTDCERDSLLDMRGGCRCSWPTVAAPCGACTGEINDAEAEELLEEFFDRSA